MLKVQGDQNDNFCLKSKVIALHLSQKFIGNKSGQNFWPESQVIALHFGPKFTGNKSG